MRYALTLALVMMAPCIVQASDLDLHHDRNWASKAMSEDHRHTRGQVRYRPYRERHTHRPSIRPTHYYRDDPPREHHHHHHPDTRVYGVETRGPQAVRRDVLSNVVCFPAIEALSVEANTEDGAFRDGMRNWENKVRWLYGERHMAIGNAVDVTKRCSRSSGNQSLVGRALEAIADAHKWRCEVVARPCMAPVVHSPAVKGE